MIIRMDRECKAKIVGAYCQDPAPYGFLPGGSIQAFPGVLSRESILLQDLENLGVAGEALGVAAQGGASGLSVPAAASALDYFGRCPDRRYHHEEGIM